MTDANEPLRREFSTLFEFLDTFRADIQDGYLTVPTTGEYEAGAPCTVAVEVPIFEDDVEIAAEIVDIEEQGLMLRLEESDDGFERLEWIYEMCGRFIEEMLSTGRFKLIAQPGAADAPVPEAGASAASPASTAPATPRSDGVPLGVEPQSSGELTAESFRDILMKAYKDEFKGIIQLDHPLGTSTIYCERGGPVQVRDDPVVVEECLGVLLVRAGRLNEEQLKASLEMMNQTGKLQGECLIEQGLLTFPVLVMAMMKQSEIKILRLAEQAEGSYEVHPLEQHHTKFITPQLKVPAVLFKMLRAGYESVRSEVVAERQSPFLDLYSRVDLDFPVDDLQLKKHDKEFLEILGRRSYRLRQIYSVSNQGRQATALNLLTLIDLGILQFDKEEDQTQILGNVRKQVEDKHNVLQDQNLFEQLEIHWAARDIDVEQAYERLKQLWTTMGEGVKLPAELMQKRSEILESLEQAFAVLHPVRSRQQYRREQYEAQQIQFSADIFFRQGEMLIIKKRWKEVIENLERAVELSPENRKYLAALKTIRNRPRD